MLLDQSHVVFYLIDIHYKVPYGAPKKCIILYYRPNWRLCLQSVRYKFCNLTSFIRLRRKIKNSNNISLKFIMLTEYNQIFRNWFVIIHRHLTKVSAQIIQCIIFERNELSITLSTLWLHYQEKASTDACNPLGACNAGAYNESGRA